MPSIAIVTCKNIPEPDPDEAMLMQACQEAGIAAELVPWEEAQVDWSRFDQIVLHSTWNYYEHEAKFRAWIESVSPLGKLCNVPSLVMWNLDKHYLGELQSKGIPIVPTRYISTVEDLALAVMEEGWEEFVVKPTVSAASFMTRRFSVADLDDAGRFVEDILLARGAMVQKYMSRVAEGGEIALVHVDGQLTHGIVKSPRFEGGDESVSAAITPTSEQKEVARRVMNAVTEHWLYARVDLMLAEDGQWLLSELELIEPSLFFLQHKPALDRFVAALKRATAE